MVQVLGLMMFSLAVVELVELVELVAVLVETVAVLVELVVVLEAESRPRLDQHLEQRLTFLR